MLLSHDSCHKSSCVKSDLVVSEMGMVRRVLSLGGGYVVFRCLEKSIDRLSLIEFSSVLLNRSSNSFT